MKTINFLTSHFLPENTACTNRVVALIKELEKKYKVNVIALTEKGKFQKNNKVNYSENTNIYYVNQEVYGDNHFALRAYYEIKYISKLIKIANSTYCDITIATAPYMFMIPLVSFRVKGKKILDIRDLVWEYIAEKNFIKKIIKFSFQTIMKPSIKRFDQVVVTNDREVKLLEENYITKKIDTVYNGISLERYEELIKIDKLNSEKFTVTYIGNIGFAHNLQLLVSVAKELKEINFVIIGDGMELEDIKEYAIKNNIKNVEFTGKLTWDKIKPYYENSTVLYAQLQERLLSAMPSKLYEYASTGLPIIYGGTGQAVSFVDKLEQSVIIKPDNFVELKNILEEIQFKNFKISMKNRALVEENYLREISSEKFTKIVSKYI